MKIRPSPGRWACLGLGLAWLTGPMPTQAAESVEPPWQQFEMARPRLFINAHSLPAVRAYATGPLHALYITRKAYLLSLADTDFQTPADHGLDAAAAAFVYLCEGGQEYFALARNLLRSSLAYYRQCDQDALPVSWYAFSRIHAITAYDWLYEHLSKEERRAMGRDILDHVVADLAVPSANRSGPLTGFYGTPSLFWYAGIATRGTGIDEPLSDRGIALGYQLNLELLQSRQEIAGDDGACGTATLGYALRAYPWAEFNFFHTFKSAFGVDIATDWRYVARLPNYVLWNRLPGARECGVGDAFHVDNALPEEALFTHLAQIRHFFGATDPREAALAAWLQDQGRTQNYFLAASPITPFLLTNLTQAPSAAPPAADLPLARHFAGLGQFMLRSGWGESDTYATFIAGGLAASQKHYDENHFVIYKQGFLALDSGTRPEPGSHLFQYYCRTVAHNTILIRMEGEVLPPFWGVRALDEPHLPTPNDGGMCHVTGAVVRAFQTNPAFTYIASDATACYAPAKCALALRQFVHIQPDLFVICDRVTVTRPEYAKTWVLHTAREPQVVGAGFAAEQGEGRLFCRTLLPHNALLTPVGGPGREFWNDGRNWPLPTNTPNAIAQTEVMGAWRVEVAPTHATLETLFLHLLEVGGRATKTNMVTATLLEQEGRSGLTFTTQDTTWTLWFGTRGEPSCELRRLTGEHESAFELPNTVAPQAIPSSRGGLPALSNSR